jgi:hypothetical protein
MTKKWLYSAAVGALLIASEAFGVTVQDVLKIDWDNYRWNFDKLAHTYSGMYRNKIMKDTYTTRADGTVENTFVQKASFNNGGINWKYTAFYDGIQGEDSFSFTTQSNLKNKVKGKYTDKTSTQKDFSADTMITDYWVTNAVWDTQNVYTFKPANKNTQPMGPYVLDDTFQEDLESYGFIFYGSETKGITNIISDTEAFIVYETHATGFVGIYNGHEVNEPASLDRKTVQYLTTDKKTFRIQQTTTQTAINAGTVNSQTTVEADYTGKMNGKGRVTKVMETSSIHENMQLRPWAVKDLQSGTTSVHNEPAPEYGVRPGVAVGKHMK